MTHRGSQYLPNLLFVCLPPTSSLCPGWGRGTNAPGSEDSLNGHGVVLFSLFHRRGNGSQFLSKVTEAVSGG
jgi:hypothetical protein